jgi:hypothetical protein
VCKNCHNALEKTYEDYLKSQPAVDQASKNDAAPSARNLTAKLSLTDPAISTITGLMKNIVDSFNVARWDASENGGDANKSHLHSLKSSEPASRNSEDVEDEDEVDDEEDAAAADSELHSDSSFDESGVSTPVLVHSPMPTAVTSPPVDSSVVVARNGSDWASSTPPRTISSNKLIVTRRLTQKKEPIHSEYGYLGKIAIEPDLNDGGGDETRKEAAQVKWERCYFVLYDDYSIAVCASNVSVTQPQFFIQLEKCALKEINETTFGLDVVRNNNCSNSSTNDSVTQNASGNIKNKLRLFESNYEMKFSNKETK